MTLALWSSVFQRPRSRLCATVSSSWGTKANTAPIHFQICIHCLQVRFQMTTPTVEPSQIPRGENRWQANLYCRDTLFLSVERMHDQRHFTVKIHWTPRTNLQALSMLSVRASWCLLRRAHWRRDDQLCNQQSARVFGTLWKMDEKSLQIRE